MTARAGVFALAILAATPQAAALAADDNETVVIAPPVKEAGKAEIRPLNCAKLPGRRAMLARRWRICREWHGQDLGEANWWCGAPHPRRRGW